MKEIKDFSPDVIIRPIQFSDLKRIYGWLKQSDIIESILLGKRINALEEEIKWFEKYSKDDTKNVFAIEFKHHHVGNASLFNIDKFHGRANLSIFIGDENCRGKGLGYETLRIVLNFAFNNMSLYRISLEVLEDNLHAINCYKKIGMQEEGILRSYVNIQNRRCNMIVFSILRDEFFRANQ
jgi:[ribosomal protein S5]-alanine N-acetyltransferase